MTTYRMGLPNFDDGMANYAAMLREGLAKYGIVGMAGPAQQPLLAFFRLVRSFRPPNDARPTRLNQIECLF